MSTKWQEFTPIRTTLEVPSCILEPFCIRTHSSWHSKIRRLEWEPLPFVLEPIGVPMRTCQMYAVVPPMPLKCPAMDKRDGTLDYSMPVTE